MSKQWIICLECRCKKHLRSYSSLLKYFYQTFDLLTSRLVYQIFSRTQGYTTTTMPTTWMNDSSRVLCAFEHASLLVGTMVLISESAPVCCCPRSFSQKDQLGRWNGLKLLCFRATPSIHKSLHQGQGIELVGFKCVSFDKMEEKHNGPSIHTSRRHVHG